MNYGAYDTLVQPARASPGLPRLAAGLGLTVLLFLAAGVVYGDAVRTFSAAFGLDPGAASRGTTAWGALVNLYVFALLIAALGLALRVVHGRSLRGLIGPAGPALRQSGRCLGALILLHLALVAVPSPAGLVPEPHLPPQRWLALLAPALLGLLIQVSAEEMVFRGYLQSQLAARFRHPVVWLGASAIVFAALHYAPSEAGPNAPLIALWAGLFALAAGDLTARAGTLGPAIALHLANNAGAILLAAPQGSFDGLALYTYAFGLEDPAFLRQALALDLGILFCAWLSLRLALRR